MLVAAGGRGVVGEVWEDTPMTPDSSQSIQDLVNALAEAVKSLRWAAMVIRDISEDSTYMENLREAERLVKQYSKTV